MLRALAQLCAEAPVDVGPGVRPCPSAKLRVCRDRDDGMSVPEATLPAATACREVVETVLMSGSSPSTEASRRCGRPRGLACGRRQPLSRVRRRRRTRARAGRRPSRPERRSERRPPAGHGDCPALRPMPDRRIGALVAAISLPGLSAAERRGTPAESSENPGRLRAPPRLGTACEGSSGWLRAGKPSQPWVSVKGRRERLLGGDAAPSRWLPPTTPEDRWPDLPLTPCSSTMHVWTAR